MSTKPHRAVVLRLPVLLALGICLGLASDAGAQGGYWKYVGSRIERCEANAKTDYCTAAGGRNALKLVTIRTGEGGEAYTDVGVSRWEINGRRDALAPGQVAYGQAHSDPAALRSPGQLDARALRLV